MADEAETEEKAFRGGVAVGDGRPNLGHASIG